MPLSTPTVFVVDDDVSVRESLQLLIESAGWQSQTFASAREFMCRSPIQAGPSCLLLDASLLDFSRVELKGSLALDSVEMPMILISGYDAREVNVRATEFGAVAVLTKPLEADGLLRAIEQAFGRSRDTLGPGTDVVNTLCE
jgi:FixJ family two-component response regulator